MEPHYRTADIELSPAGDHHLVLYSLVSGAAEVIHAGDAAMLQYCRTWLTLDEHAQSWCREQELAPLKDLSAARGSRWAVWLVEKFHQYAEHKRASLALKPEQLEKTRRRLEELARKGFLVSAESLLDDLRRSAPLDSVPPPIASIGITTRNRDEVLRRGLLSHFENRKRFGRSNDYIVIDDAGDPISQDRTRAMLLSLCGEFGVSIRYAGRSERQRFAALVAGDSGIRPDLIQFALFGLPSCPVTTGSARNCLLLATAGDRFVMVDDDSVCRLAACPSRAEGFAFNSRPDPTEFWFFTDREATLRNSTFEDLDFLGLHETLLGRNAGECLPASADFAGVDLHAAGPRFDRCLRLWDGRVRASMAGVVGDSGIGSTAYLLVDLESQRRLTGSEAQYLAAVRSRQVLRCVRRPTISEGTSCIAVNLGLDNRTLLPPFIPVQRNSDGLFAQALRVCFRDAYLGHLPWAVLHDPAQIRQQDYEEYKHKRRHLRMSDLIIPLLQASRPPWDGAPEAASLGRLGAYLEDCGSLDAAQFNEVLQKQIWRGAAGILSGKLPPEIPPAEKDFYARYRQEYIDTLRERMTQPDYLVPDDLRQAGDEEQVRALSREVVRRFGELLRVWPEIDAAARRLRSKGEELAPPLRA